jgi:hypothetical protein
MNTQKHSASRKTPYQIFFGIRPNNKKEFILYYLYRLN